MPSQLYGVGPATDVTVSCRVQAYPSAINYWVKDQVIYLNMHIQYVYHLLMQLHCTSFDTPMMSMTY